MEDVCRHPAALEAGRLFWEFPSMTVAAGWIAGGWIFSERPQQDGKYWIQDNWIWGPAGGIAASPNTGYWIDGDWIWGPVGADQVRTGFWIKDGWIWGPGPIFPFAK
jgi:hypothetical protein